NGGTVYVTEHDKNDVIKHPPGATSGTVLPFTALNTPSAGAGGRAPSIHLAGRGGDRGGQLGQ
ncbi:hypothetical protein, partial [Mycobacterium avium]|uniref:hypothetical protein n=1 Tax=Mycobacterium avium TaxID=1764 RepID=UPI00115C34B2